MSDPTKNQDKILSDASLANAGKVRRSPFTTATLHTASQYSGPKLLFAGEAAAAAIARILPTASSITLISGFGPVELRPGTIWDDNRILIAADTALTRYAVDDRLYEWTTSAFLREEWLQAASRAMAQAKVFVHLAKVEIALISGLLVPWYVLLGVGAASIGLTYYTNRDTYNAALQQGPTAIRLLHDLRQRSPMLFQKLLTTAARDILVNLPSGVSGEDLGFFLGRVVRGLQGAPAITLGLLLRTILRVAAIVGVIRLPKITAEAIANAARARAGELQARLTEHGIAVTTEEAESLLRELLSRTDTPQKLQELQQTLGALIPVLERLSHALHQ